MRRLSGIIILVLIFFVLFANVASGQYFAGGLKTGVTASEVSGDRLGGPNKPGWFASVFSSLEIGRFSSLQLELMFIQKGSRSVPNERNNFRDYRFNLQYVEIPFSYSFGFAALDLPFATRLTGEAGVSLSVLVDHHEEENDLIIDLTEERPFNVSELNLFLGLKYPLYGPVDIAFRFSQGVTPIRPHLGGTAVWYNRGQYNSVWSIGLSYTVF